MLLCGLENPEISWSEPLESPEKHCCNVGGRDMLPRYARFFLGQQGPL